MSDQLRARIHQSKEFSSLEEAVFLGLCLTAQLLEQPWNRYLVARERINVTQYNVLRILRGAGAGGLTVGEISLRMINRDRDVMPLMEQLVARGLVVDADAKPHDRLDRLAITPDGLALLANLDPDVKAMPPRIFDHLTDRELAQLDALLGRVMEGDLSFP